MKYEISEELNRILTRERNIKGYHSKPNINYHLLHITIKKEAKIFKLIEWALVIQTHFRV
jgi:hypothetical protein